MIGKKEKRRINVELDRFQIYVAREMGQLIRQEAHIRGVTLSKLIGEVFEEHFNPTKNEEE